MTLVNAAGTPLAKAPGGTVLESQEELEPKVKVLVNVYEDSAYDHVNFPTVKKQLKFRAGQIIKQKEWDAAFATPTISTVFPATGPAAGGTAITITGKNYAPGATVTVGGTAATSIVVVNPAKITAVTPAKTAGAHDVAVTTTGGTATADDAFTTT
jgi:hypothetical protein